VVKTSARFTLAIDLKSCLMYKKKIDKLYKIQFLIGKYNLIIELLNNALKKLMNIEEIPPNSCL